MIVRTLKQAQKAACFRRIICVSDSPEIIDVVESAGFEGILSPENFRTGSDRVAWAAQQLDSQWVLNLQGDEPIVEPELLQKICTELLTWKQGVVTGASPLGEEDFQNPHVVKLNMDEKGDISQFFRQGEVGSETWMHKGIYAYPIKLLNLFTASETTSAEAQHSLEQLRIFPEVEFRAVRVFKNSRAVDVPSDVALVEQELAAVVC